jgi:nitrate reductase assembly molybdenum cofactor insertion protein NarJ
MNTPTKIYKDMLIKALQDLLDYPEEQYQGAKNMLDNFIHNIEQMQLAEDELFFNFNQALMDMAKKVNSDKLASKNPIRYKN